jgi:hypothetical protein
MDINASLHMGLPSYGAISVRLPTKLKSVMPFLRKGVVHTEADAIFHIDNLKMVLEILK